MAASTFRQSALAQQERNQNLVRIQPVDAEHAACSHGTYGDGTVFRLKASGKIETLHSFLASGTEGRYLIERLTERADGSVCGVTAFGGKHNGGTEFCPRVH